MKILVYCVLQLWNSPETAERGCKFKVISFYITIAKCRQTMNYFRRTINQFLVGTCQLGIYEIIYVVYRIIYMIMWFLIYIVIKLHLIIWLKYLENKIVLNFPKHDNIVIRGIIYQKPIYMYHTTYRLVVWSNLFLLNRLKCYHDSLLYVR